MFNWGWPADYGWKFGVCQSLKIHSFCIDVQIAWFSEGFAEDLFLAVEFSSLGNKRWKPVKMLFLWRLESFFDHHRYFARFSRLINNIHAYVLMKRWFFSSCESFMSLQLLTRLPQYHSEATVSNSSEEFISQSHPRCFRMWLQFVI